MEAKDTHPLLLLQTALEVQRDNDVEDFCHLCVAWSLAGGLERILVSKYVRLHTCLGEAKLFVSSPDIPSDARIAEVGDRQATQSPALAPHGVHPRCVSRRNSGTWK